jgi:GDP-L-fucose synthase
MPGDKVFVTGHLGLAGRAINAEFERAGYDVLVRTRSELDLRDQRAVRTFLQETKPDVVILAAAKVGGIGANVAQPADFICENVIIEHNVIWGSHLAGINRLVFVASSAIYPRVTQQPMPEKSLMSGKLEPTLEAYAIAKITGVAMCRAIQTQFGRNYFSVVPPNLYGTHDNFDLDTANVFPALIRKVHEAAITGSSVEVWGSGKPKREFLSSGDLARGIRFLIGKEDVEGFINVGTGIGISIKNLVETMQKVIGHTGEIVWNTTKPDGFPEKTLDTSRLKGLGWMPQTDLQDGIKLTHAWYAENAPKGLVRCG